MPVMLPPGRAKLAMKPEAIGLLTIAVTIGARRPLLRNALTTRAPSMTMFSSQGFHRRSLTVACPRREAFLDYGVAALNPAERQQRLSTSAPVRLSHCRTYETDVSDARGTAGIARARHSQLRPRRRPLRRREV